MQNWHIHKLWQKVLQTPEDFFNFFFRSVGSQVNPVWYGLLQIFQAHRCGLFIHATYMALLYLLWKSRNGLTNSKIVGLKSIFFLIESSNWMAYIACWCEHFVRSKNTKQMSGFGRKKVYYSLPQIGGLNCKTNLFYHYTEKLEILWCVYVVSRDVISHVMYICFMASHSLWCEFGWFNPALSVALAKFAFISRDGAKSGEKRFVFLS